MRHPLVCASSASSPRSPCFETSLKPLLSPPLYLPPPQFASLAAVWLTLHLAILLLFSSSHSSPSCTHVPLLSLRSFPVPRACRCSPHTRHHTRVHPFACADSRSSRNLVRHPSMSRPRPCHTHWTPFIHPFESPSHPSHPARPTVHIRAPTLTHMQCCPCVWSRLFPSPTLRLLCALRLPNFTAKSLQVLAVREQIHEFLAATCACDAHSSSIAPWWRYASTG